jgi:NADPH:quinone reductase-like Zn-dependent oxidoreductase
MRVVEYSRFGDESVLDVCERPTPSAGPGELLVRVRAAALNPKDVFTRSGRMRTFSGTRFPKRVGYDWAGEVVALGPGVTGFTPGQAVYGMIQRWAGGAVAEYAAVRVGELAAKPARLSFEQAAAVPLAALTALQALRDDARVRAGQRVLINGASGGVGTFAVQIARALGARVVAVASGRNRALLEQLGAHEVMDYTVQPPTQVQPRVDVFFDVFGNQPFARARQALTPHGVWVSTVLRAHVALAHLRTLFFTAQRARLVLVRSRRSDLEQLARWADAGQLEPVLEAVFPMEEVARAQRQLATKRTRGKVVLRIAPEPAPVEVGQAAGGSR